VGFQTEFTLNNRLVTHKLSNRLTTPQLESVATAMQCEDVSLQTHAHTSMQRVLVVDDDRAIRETLRIVLEEEGYLVAEASDGLSALEIIRGSLQPLVVVLDFIMPRLDGAGVLRAVLEDPALAARHAYILTTANIEIMPKGLVSLLARIAVPILPKPLDLDDLLGTVEDGACRVTPGRGF
jgi:CheY-like chemotaxis protein